MTRSHSLLKLQQIDSQLDRHNKRMAELSLLLADEHSVRQSRSRLDSAQAAAKEVSAAYRVAQDESNAVEHKRKASEDRLYSGSVTDPKELQDLNNEVASLGRRLRILEDRQLEAMLVQDDADASEASARSDHVATESEWKSAQAALSEDLHEHEHAFAQLESEREAALEIIRPEDCKTYERLRKIKRGVAVVPVGVGGVCGACGMVPSTSRLQQARSSAELIQCGNCGRILCVV